MFYHVKDLQFNARVSKPDPAFATLLLEQFGGANGELAAALRYFGQAFGAKKPYPDKYDLLMDIATEEFSHLEIVGATIQMLLTGINGDLKDAANNSEIMQLMDGKAAKENMIHQGMVAPQFFVGTAGGPAYTNSQGVPWSAAYINGDVQGDLTSELRSNIGAETRAKMVYEYLLQFTDDPYIKETLNFLMTREVAHYQMFEAALASIQPNFPPGVLQSDPRYSNLYFNFSSGNDFRGPWNEGKSSQFGETFQYIEDPIQHVLETNGLLDQKVNGSERSPKDVQLQDKEMSSLRSMQVNEACPVGEEMQWNDPAAETGDAARVTKNSVAVEPGADASKTAVEFAAQNGNGNGNGKRKTNAKR
jgi:Mn-containing catalase